MQVQMKIDLTLVSLPEFTVSSNTNLSTAKFSEDAYFPKEIRLPRIKDGTKTDLRLLAISSSIDSSRILQVTYHQNKAKTRQ